MSLASYSVVNKGVEIELNENVVVPIEMSPRGGIKAESTELRQGTVGVVSRKFEGGPTIAVIIGDNGNRQEYFLPASKISLRHWCQT